MTTDIEWADDVWNLTRGCRRISPGCLNCYAERQAARFSGPGMPYEGLVKIVKRDVRQLKMKNGEPTGDFRTVIKSEPHWTGKGRFVVEKLSDPLRRKKPTRYFVNSMSDLFFEEFTNEQIAAAFGVMAACPQHTFMILTKRQRMRAWFEWVGRSISGGYASTGWNSPAGACRQHAADILGGWNGLRTPPSDSPHEWRVWPLPNVWIGVSVENQDAANERIPELLEVPAAVRFLSCEPLIGPVDLTLRNIPSWDEDLKYNTLTGEHWTSPREEEPPVGPKLDWVIIGCESGPGARPCEVEWIRDLVHQCSAAGTATFLKQAPFVHGNMVVSGLPCLGHALDEGDGSHRKGNVISLPYLDGKQYAEFPQVQQP